MLDWPFHKVLAFGGSGPTQATSLLLAYQLRALALGLPVPPKAHAFQHRDPVLGDGVLGVSGMLKHRQQPCLMRANRWHLRKASCKAPGTLLSA